MRKIKLLLLLTLLCVGVSESWAAKTYRVIYDGLPSGKNGGFSPVYSYEETSGTYRGNTIYAVFSATSSTFTMTPSIYNYYGWQNLGTSYDSYLPTLTDDNITDYISATLPYSNYDAIITVDNTATEEYDGTITITYYRILDGQANVFNVVYDGLPAGYSGDYQVTNPWRDSNKVLADSRAPIYVKYSKISSSEMRITVYSSEDGAPIQIAISGDTYYANPEWYIKPLAIDGYDATVTSSGRTITITYSPTTVVKWHDDIFEYSTRHTQGTGNVQDLSSKNEVSISLWLGRNASEFKEVTDTMIYYGHLWAGAQVGETRVLPDYGNEDINATATYECIRNYASGRQIYLRTRTVPISTVTEVLIPREKEYNGKTYQVTAIQKWGFCYAASNWNARYSCESEDYDQWKKEVIDPNDELTEAEREQKLVNDLKLASYDYDNINDHRNDYLVKVRFESPSNVKQIGDYAFMSNTRLQSIIVPNSVELLGQGAWECCRALTELQFQTRDDGTVGFSKIQNFTFWWCTALETLILPDGITEIEGTAKGAPLQYMFALNDLKLPNTLEKIGAHFVCGCRSLETLTIPASVTEINGACFHGCENLESVILLGKASSLAAYASERDKTFGENSVFCHDHVNNAKFYTTADYVTSYASGGDDGTSAWYLIADNRDDEGYLIDPETNERILDQNGLPVQVTGGAGDGYGNQLLVIKPEEREFKAGKWVTACFYEDIENYKSETKFGKDAIAAIMIDKTQYARSADQEQDLSKDLQGNLYTYAVGNDPYRYHVSFEEINDTKIPANTPVLICPSNTWTVEVVPAANIISDKDNLNVLRTSEVKASFTDGPNKDKTATIKMLSRFVDDVPLNPGDFYFKSSGKKTETGATEPAVIGSFKKVGSEQSKAPHINWGRCFWQVLIDNVVDVSSKSSLDMMSYFWGDETNGVKNVERQPEIVVDGIYDMQGRKLNINQADLPQGLFIVNGKKVVKK